MRCRAFCTEESGFTQIVCRVCRRQQCRHRDRREKIIRQESMLSHEKPFFVRPRSGSVAWGRNRIHGFHPWLLKLDPAGVRARLILISGDSSHSLRVTNFWAPDLTSCFSFFVILSVSEGSALMRESDLTSGDPSLHSG